jgi:uncharacterized membrane protein YphA (DoxX/SURF4 family)
MITFRKATVWAGAALLAVAFIAIGVSKLAGASAARWGERFEQWGYPANTHYAVGLLEVLGGIGMVVPRWRRAASLTLAVLMAAALGTHVVNGELARVVPPLVFGGLALLVFRSASGAP